MLYVLITLPNNKIKRKVIKYTLYFSFPCKMPSKNTTNFICTILAFIYTYLRLDPLVCAKDSPLVF